MNKTIVIINQYIGSPYHGMEYRHYYLAKNLIKNGYKVTLVSGSYSHLFSTLPTIKGSFTREDIEGIEYIWVQTPKYKSSKSVGRIWNMIYFSFMLRFLKDIEPSHIIVSSPSLFPIKVARKLAKKFNTKFLFEVRDLWPQTLVELSNLTYNNPLIKIMDYYEKYAYRHAYKTISLLPSAMEYYQSKGMKREKFYYLPNGIEVEYNKNTPLDNETIGQIPKNKFTIAYTGTVGIANNLDYLIDIAESLRDNRDIHFIILGEGGERKRLENRALELKLENFTFIDAISKEQVNSFLTFIDVAFISLKAEKLFRFGVSPNKVFDYMYASKPIIWAIEAGNNLVKEANCGITVPLGKKELAKKEILTLFEMSKDELNKLGLNGYNFVIKNHSYEMLSKKLIKVIEE